MSPTIFGSFTKNLAISLVKELQVLGLEESAESHLLSPKEATKQLAKRKQTQRISLSRDSDACDACDGSFFLKVGRYFFFGVANTWRPKWIRWAFR